MKNLSLVLALCAFIATPAFADEHAGKAAEAAAPTTAAATEQAAAPAKKDMKKKKKKMAKKAAAEKAPEGAEAPATEAPAHN